MTDEEFKALFDSIGRDNAETRRHFDAKTAETKQHFDEKTAEMRRHFDDMQVHFDTTSVEMRQQFDKTSADMRRHFDLVAEQMKGETRLVAESVAHVAERLDRTDQKIERSAAETQAMIRFSHADLDRRIRNLEETVTDLQTRVEHLESTH